MWLNSSYVLESRETICSVDVPFLRYTCSLLMEHGAPNWIAEPWGKKAGAMSDSALDQRFGL